MPILLGPHLLKRQVNHDERSRAFPAATAPIKPVSWRHYGPVLDQGDVGSCTANAMEQWRKCKPEYRTGVTVNEAGALALYHLETQLQGGPVYPPADPGGSGLMVCKAARQLGYISSYTHIFGIDHAVGAIAVSPFITGINWYEGMFTPDANGLVSISGALAGGHEIVVIGYDPATGIWKLLNSWGPGWGQKGVFYMTDATYARLLGEQGDATVPVLQ